MDYLNYANQVQQSFGDLNQQTPQPQVEPQKDELMQLFPTPLLI